ncbi:histidine kinase [Robertkochia solimangrovi]|uniref:histidine kinase n=1 Tax=Robertkochia solimangrovi TaxID=2213046 RepID=UPI0011800279|nr:2TM domain-containing protein [Robertkochia solimangrovi]TRZ42831.1 histidine kinase [Robertkochia solimangrovi]
MKGFIRELVKAFLIGVAVFAVFLLINMIYSGNYGVTFDQAFLRRFLFNQVYSVAIYFANMWVMKWLMGRYGYKFLQPRRLLFPVTLSFLATFLTMFLLNLFFKVGVDRQPLQEFLKAQEPAQYYGSIIVTIIIVAGFYAFYYYKHKKESQVARQKVIAGTATAQFDALKNQLDPHFLFNSLNVLTSLIEENPEAAQKFTTSLSKIYRYVLEQKNKELVSVDEELRFARTYVSLLKMRFEDSIRFELPDAASDPEMKVVPLSLQLLLENAVKHNMVNPSHPLTIRIFEEDGYLVVTNNLQPKQVVKKGSGVGLRNIAERYALLTSKEVYLNETASEFIVKIPMLSKQVSAMEVQQDYIAEKRYQRAKERVQAMKGFYSNLIAYLIVIPCLGWLNYKTTDFPWIIFPAAGWGFGVIMHYMEAFDYNPLWGKNWEARKIRELMDKENN